MKSSKVSGWSTHHRYRIRRVRHTLRKAWGGGNEGVKLFIGESNSALEFTELGEFDFVGGGEEFLTLEDIDLSPWAGLDRVIRIEIVGNFMGIDYLEFAAQDQTPPAADIVDVTPDPRNSSAGVVAINFDKDVSGVDISDLTLTRDGNAVDISGLTLTEISPSQYGVDLSTVTTTDGNYELNLNSIGSGIQDMAGNALAADAIDQFAIDMTSPQVESVVVNAGSAQRSRVSELKVVFSEDVGRVDASSFRLTRTFENNSSTIVPTVATEVVEGKTIATLTFIGSGFDRRSLADGDYTLTTLAGTVRDAAGNALDGNRDGVGGDDATDEFFRYFGDLDGDRDVDARDFRRFRRTYRKMAKDAAFNVAFDFDGDGDVDARDFRQFRSRYRMILSS